MNHSEFLTIQPTVNLSKFGWHVETWTILHETTAEPLIHKFSDKQMAISCANALVRNNVELDFFFFTELSNRDRNIIKLLADKYGGELVIINDWR